MPEVRLPDKWNEWEIVEQVGMGSFGTVYKAREDWATTVFSVQSKLYIFRWKNRIRKFSDVNTKMRIVCACIIKIWLSPV